MGRWWFGSWPLAGEKMMYGRTEFMGRLITPAVQAACGSAPPVDAMGLPLDASTTVAYSQCAAQAELEESCRNPIRTSSIAVMGGVGLFLGAGAGALLGALFGKTAGGAITGAVLGTAAVVLPTVLVASSQKKQCAIKGLVVR